MCHCPSFDCVRWNSPNIFSHFSFFILIFQRIRSFGQMIWSLRLCFSCHRFSFFNLNAVSCWLFFPWLNSINVLNLKLKSRCRRHAHTQTGRDAKRRRNSMKIIKKTHWWWWLWLWKNRDRIRSGKSFFFLLVIFLTTTTTCENDFRIVQWLPFVIHFISTELSGFRATEPKLKMRRRRRKTKNSHRQIQCVTFIFFFFSFCSVFFPRIC